MKRLRITIYAIALLVIVITQATARGSILYASDLGGYMASVDLSTGTMTKLPYAMGVGLVHGLA